MGVIRAFRDGCEWHLCPLCGVDLGDDVACSHSFKTACPGGSQPITQRLCSWLCLSPGRREGMSCSVRMTVDARVGTAHKVEGCLCR